MALRTRAANHLQHVQAAAMIDPVSPSARSPADWYQLGWEHAERGVLDGWPPRRYNPRINAALALGRNACMDAYGAE